MSDEVWTNQKPDWNLPEILLLWTESRSFQPDFVHYLIKHQNSIFFYARPTARWTLSFHRWFKITKWLSLYSPGLNNTITFSRAPFAARTVNLSCYEQRERRFTNLPNTSLLSLHLARGTYLSDTREKSKPDGDYNVVVIVVAVS